MLKYWSLESKYSRDVLVLVLLMKWWPFFLHKYNVILRRHYKAPWRHLIRDTLPRCWLIYYYRPQTKLQQGNIFTNVCPQGVVSVSVHAGIHPPRTRDRYTHPQEQRAPSPREQRQTPPRADPPGADTPPIILRRACWDIRSTSGRYASYWNAILLHLCFSLQLNKL